MRAVGLGKKMFGGGIGCGRGCAGGWRLEGEGMS